MRRTGRKEGKNRVMVYLNDDNPQEKAIADLLFDEKLVYDKNKFIKDLIIKYLEGSDIKPNPTLAVEKEKIKTIGDIEDEVSDDLAGF